MKSLKFKVLFKFKEKDTPYRHIVGLYDYNPPNDILIGTTGEDRFDNIIVGDIWGGKELYDYRDKYWNYGLAPFHFDLPKKFFTTKVVKK